MPRGCALSCQKLYSQPPIRRTYGMRASESSTSRISPRVLSNSGDSMKAFFVIAFCACTQPSARGLWLGSSHRYGSLDGAVADALPGVAGGFANAMPERVTPNAKIVQRVFMIAVPRGFPEGVSRAPERGRV